MKLFNIIWKVIITMFNDLKLVNKIKCSYILYASLALTSLIKRPGMGLNNMTLCVQ